MLLPYLWYVYCLALQMLILAAGNSIRFSCTRHNRSKLLFALVGKIFANSPEHWECHEIENIFIVSEVFCKDTVFPQIYQIPNIIFDNKNCLSYLSYIQHFCWFLFPKLVNICSHYKCLYSRRANCKFARTMVINNR